MLIQKLTYYKAAQGMDMNYHKSSFIVLLKSVEFINLYSGLIEK
jgi:hypothetical protein